MFPVVNMGAVYRPPVYRMRKLFRGLGQDDWTDVNPDAGISTDVAPPPDIVPSDVTPSNPDWGSSIETGNSQVTASGAGAPVGADTGSGQTLTSTSTSETTPSNLSTPQNSAAGGGNNSAPSKGGGGAASSAAAAGGTDVLTSIGKFFTTIFTPSTVAAGAAVAKDVSTPKAKPAPLLTIPIGSSGIPIDTNTLLVAGGVTVGVLVLVSFLRP